MADWIKRLQDMPFMKQLFIQACLLAALAFYQSMTVAAENQLHLDSYKGKVVYLDFWASWCGPCRKSFPWMNDIYRANERKGLVIIAVNLDQERTLADKFIAEWQPDFSIFFDPNGTLASQFQVKGMPSAVIIGRDGKIRYTHTGFHQDKLEQYEQELLELLAEPAP
jgi:thiol-disulfide isomerase/thioredoxin